MKQWNFLQVSIHLKNLDKASGLLWDLGTQGIEEQYLKSSKVRIKAYFDSASDIRALTRKFKFQRSEEHTSELQSPYDLVCRLLLEKKKKKKKIIKNIKQI